jgi:hypothetical protein
MASQRSYRAAGPITDEGNARFFRQFTQDLHSQSVVGLRHIGFRDSGNPRYHPEAGVGSPTNHDIALLAWDDRKPHDGLGWKMPHSLATNAC